MNRERLQKWLTLANIDGVGWATAHKLLLPFNDIDDLFAASETELRQIGASSKLIGKLLSAKRYDLSAIEQWLEASESHHILTPESSQYPHLLKQASGAPLILYGKGRIELLHQPQLAIVGTRHPSPIGQQATRDFAREVVEHGLVVTSGLALGIDGIAHQSALDANGTTVAVAGTGLDRVYPARHKSLAHRIAEEGLIISEFALGTPIKGTNFPKRNRIISALSLGTLVVEAAVKSGSLITAQLALEQGREVFAVPGSIRNPLAKGCHHLIRQGAHLVESAEEILEQLGFLALAQKEGRAQSPDAFHPDRLSNNESEVLHQIDFAPTPMDTLVERCKKSVAELSSNLLTLELDGWITSVAGGVQRIR